MKIADIYYVYIFLIYSVTNSLIIGNRDIHIGKDTSNYYNFYYAISSGYTYQGFSDPIFILLAKIAVYLGLKSKSFLVIVSFLSSFILLLSCYIIMKRVIEKKIYITSLVVIMLNLLFLSPFYWGAQLNIIRAGLSIPLIFLSIHFFSANNKFSGAFFAVLASLIHITNIQFVILFFVFSFFNEKGYRKFENLYLKFYFFIIVGYLTGINRMISNVISLSAFGADQYNSYLTYDNNASNIYEAGIRYDFAFFTILFVSLLYISKKRLNSKYFNNFFYYSTITTIPFFLIGYIPFSDRLLSTFWMLIPLLLIFFIYTFVRPRYLLHYSLPLFSIFLFINYYFSISSYMY
ncbi:MULTISPECIES: EpsG family protein [unclassified Psychrobacter]|uniref:EpsG family protein n=1 Tax=unclassified Psychrobacter TaxID=196806 RepID=UPI0025F227EA|nr:MULTISPECIES: EpsG family protein [unclassified Psychrobacter]